MPKAQSSTFEYSKKDLYKNFYLTVPGITGINQNFSPNTILDTECQQIWNYAYVGRGNIRKVSSAKKLYSTTKPAIYIITAYLGSYTQLVILSDGSVYNWDGSTLTNIAAAETLSGDPEKIDACVWQNQRIYIIDSNGYFKWDGSTWTQVSSTIVGHAIVVWQGRVFVANGSVVSYTVALDPEDFAGTGSGYFDVASSFPDLKIKVKKLVGYVDSLVIYGDNAQMVLTGSTISNDPSEWYLTEVSNVTGVQYKNSVVVYKNEIFFQNSKGLFKGTISQQEKYDYKVNLVDNEIGKGQFAVYPLYNLLNYFIPINSLSPFRTGITKNILLFNYDLGEFSFIDIGVDVNGIYYSFIDGVEDCLLALCSDGVYKLFYGTDSIPSYIKTKMFDLGKFYIDKFWWVFLLKTYLRSDVTFELTVETDTQRTTGVAEQVAEVPLFLFTDGTEIYYWTDGDEIYSNFSSMTTAIKDIIFLNNTSGSYAVYEIKENSSSIFDIYGFMIKGIIGRTKL